MPVVHEHGERMKRFKNKGKDTAVSTDPTVCGTSFQYSGASWGLCEGFYMHLPSDLSTDCRGCFHSFRDMMWSCWDVVVVGYRLRVSSSGLSLLPASLGKVDADTL